MVNSETAPEAPRFARCGSALEEGWAVDRVQGVPGPPRGDVNEGGPGVLQASLGLEKQQRGNQ